MKTNKLAAKRTFILDFLATVSQSNGNAIVNNANTQLQQPYNRHDRQQLESLHNFHDSSDFQPPSLLALPNFKGCIELDTLNEEVLSLYNFEKIFQVNTTEDKPCGRSNFINI